MNPLARPAPKRRSRRLPNAPATSLEARRRERDCLVRELQTVQQQLAHFDALYPEARTAVSPLTK
jgi:hypothetical protein